MKRSNYIGLLILCTVSLFSLNSCVSSPALPAPNSTKAPPIYAQADNIRTEESYDLLPKTKRTITYEVMASSQDVLDFYKENLVADGWTMGTIINENENTYYWASGCPAFGLSVSVLQSSIDRTLVELVLTSSPCL